MTKIHEIHKIIGVTNGFIIWPEIKIKNMKTSLT